jgi:hypothetical protein
MKATLLALSLLPLLVGCRASVSDVAGSRVTYSRNVRTGDIKVELWNPKETEFDHASVDPATGILKIEKFRSIPNAAAIAGQVESAKYNAQMLSETLRFSGQALDKAAAAMGRATSPTE